MHGTLPLPGDVVWIRQRRWRIERVRRDRNVVRLDVANRDVRLTFLAPFDRPATVESPERFRRVRRQEALARLAHLLGRCYGARTLAGAIDADVTILPHQLEPALAIVNGARRVLIADDVGLGKTIQADLIVAELARRDEGARVLIIVPNSLREQWADELRRRFHIESLMADRQGLDEVARAGAFGDSPWARSGVWIASSDFIKQRHVFEALPQRPWDLVVIDEAHTVTGDSDRHEACRGIAARSRHCVLLTATPHSGDQDRFERLLELGRVHGDALTVFRRTREGIGLPPNRRVHWQRVALSDAEHRALTVLMAFEAAVLRGAGAAHREGVLLLLSVFRKRALSTMGALAASLDRRLSWLGDAHRGDLDWLQPRLGFEDHSDEVGETEREALILHTGMDQRHERSWLQRLRALVECAMRVEAKASRIASLLTRVREPVVVFTEFRRSLEVIEQRLPRDRRVSVLHGAQGDPERRQQLQRFLDGETSVLLATDVAGQGLNLQTRARWVICLELPWNPARIEQRIGRVDRIGQIRPVHLTLLIARHEAESGLLSHLARRTLLARRSLGDDQLYSVAVDEAALRGSLIDQAAFEVDASVQRVSICRRWVRPARMAARQLHACRSMARRWRAPTSERSGTPCVMADRVPAIRSGERHALLVFSVPILDSSGAVIERHAVAVSVPTKMREIATRNQTVDRARTAAVQALAPRLKRVQRFVARCAQADLALDRVFASQSAGYWLPAEVQPGLFDGRDVHAFEVAKEAALVLDEGLSSDAERRCQNAVLHLGRPALELAFLES